MASPISRRAVVTHLAAGGVVTALLAPAFAHRASAQASTPIATRTPNYFYLSGEDVDIDYWTATDAGEPYLRYRSPDGEMEFAGDQVRIAGSPEFGTLATVMIGSVADGYTLDLTVLIPDINLAAGDEPTPFSTLAILTKDLTTIAGPRLIEGAIQRYQSIELNGVAELVES